MRSSEVNDPLDNSSCSSRQRGAVDKRLYRELLSLVIALLKPGLAIEQLASADSRATNVSSDAADETNSTSLLHRHGTILKHKASKLTGSRH